MDCGKYVKKIERDRTFKSKEQKELEYDTWKIRTKKIKSIFSIEKAYIPQLFLLDKLVS